VAHSCLHSKKAETWTAAGGFKFGRIFSAMRRGDRVTGEAMTSQWSRRMRLGSGYALLSMTYGGRMRSWPIAAARDQSKSNWLWALLNSNERYLGTEQDFEDRRVIGWVFTSEMPHKSGRAPDSQASLWCWSFCLVVCGFKLPGHRLDLLR
jgi:hypothetical protein